MRELQKKLGNYFKDKDEVRLAYLFGSVADEKEGPLSDIDIGVLLEDKLDRNARARMKLRMISELTSILGSDKIDLVIMNDAPPQLNYEIIKARRPLTENPTLKVGFEQRILSDYLDRRYYDRRWFRNYLKRRRWKNE
ncbi:nucleotidyltransferase domain-containing protein [Methanothermobacter sp. DP]|uniref:type VII toxin-antitoxin system MntA family adenylyltransferase antitoxin n=1 Tax=unclassified Methanothermobacter TaxID=2631116 RepID=UPI002AA5075B|nr:nucleotidyltransferase domain-containing protein [Methanothermobacter sp. DP]